jgi:hypothetical protein
MKKKVVVAIAVLILAGVVYVAYVAYGKYQHARFVGSLVPHVKNSSLRVANSARYDTEEDSKITFKELFEKLEADIAEIDKRLIEVQTLSSPATSGTTDPVVAYFKASQEYLRALLQKYRKQLALSSARDLAEKSVRDETALVDTFRPYEFYRVGKPAADQALNNQDKAENERNESLLELPASVNKLKEARERIRPLFPEDALIPATQLETVTRKILEQAKEAEASQQRLRDDAICNAYFRIPPLEQVTEQGRLLWRACENELDRQKRQRAAAEPPVNRPPAKIQAPQAVSAPTASDDNERDHIFFFSVGNRLVDRSGARIGVVESTERAHSFPNGRTRPAYLVRVPSGTVTAFPATELERSSRSD